MSDAPALDIRPLESSDEVVRAAAVLRQVWAGDRDSVPTNLMIALAHAGDYVVGMYDGDRVVGASVAFFGPPAARTMHSHITGILPEYQGHGLGRQLKEHQRRWAFTRDVGRITWTFDPLVARNAHFNLAVLGARIDDYLVDHYGAMDDGVNRDDETDRLHVTWALAARAAAPPESDVVTSVAVPRDIEVLRREDPAEAAEWRYRVRDAFLGLSDDGFRAAGWDDDRGYLFVRAG